MARICSAMGSDNCQSILAQYLRAGTAGARGSEGARHFFETAALQGNTLAMFNVAQMYDDGEGIPRNNAVAMHWYREADARGSPRAHRLLKSRGLIEIDPKVKAFLEMIDRNGPDFSNIEGLAYEVATYCIFGGKKCTEYQVAVYRFEKANQKRAEAANISRLWNVYAAPKGSSDADYAKRSACRRRRRRWTGRITESRTGCSAVRADASHVSNESDPRRAQLAHYFISFRKGSDMKSRVILPATVVLLALGASCARFLGVAPAIHDISTDTSDPPLFVDVLPLRAGARNTADYGGSRVAEQQRAAYPDIVPVDLAIAPADAFTKALATAKAMGWGLVAADSATGRIEATATTRVFRFKDDVVIRIRPRAGGSRLDIRSVSRIGGSDLGKNASRIREFITRLR